MSSRPIDLRDRALIAVMAYSLARVSAAVSIRLDDFIDLGRSQVLRLHEKGGVQRDIPAHPRLVEYLDAWIAVANLRPSSTLFPALTPEARCKPRGRAREATCSAWSSVA